MPPTILALLLAAAMLHAGWNFLVKRAGQRLIFIWWAIVMGFVAFCPALILGPRLPLRIWPYALVSTLLEVAYFYTLTRAYDRGDFSLVYPIARGTAPALLALWSALFLGELPGWGGLAGLALVIVGLVTVGGAQWVLRARAVTLGFGGLAAALATAVLISLYSAVDGGAVRFAPPVTYAVLIQGLIALTSAPVVVARFGPRAMVAEWRANWPRIVAVGLCSLTTYMLVLVAFSRARVGYAGAVREVSIVFAALAGWWLLGERFGPLRTAGSVLIFAGILTIAIAG